MRLKPGIKRAWRGAPAGMQPDQVGAVLLTEVHTGPIGWNTHLQDGRWLPLFRNDSVLPWPWRESETWNNDNSVLGIGATLAPPKP